MRLQSFSLGCVCAWFGEVYYISKKKSIRTTNISQAQYHCEQANTTLPKASF